MPLHLTDENTFDDLHWRSVPNHVIADSLREKAIYSTAPKLRPHRNGVVTRASDPQPLPRLRPFAAEHDFLYPAFLSVPQKRLRDVLIGLPGYFSFAGPYDCCTALTVSHRRAVRRLFDEEVLRPYRQVLQVEPHVVLTQGAHWGGAAAMRKVRPLFRFVSFRFVLLSFVLFCVCCFFVLVQFIIFALFLSFSCTIAGYGPFPANALNVTNRGQQNAPFSQNRETCQES